MEIHNTTEDTVLQLVHEIYDAIEQEGKPDRPCTCYQCRLDTACYVLNRVPPRYVISSRGAARSETEFIERQQEDADIVSLIYEGINKISRSKRPHFPHTSAEQKPSHPILGPVFNIPTIIGRAFNGSNFEPMTDIDVELLSEGKRARMIDPNWQNPFHLVANTAGTFTFWPEPVPAKKVGLHHTFSFAVRIEAPGFETLLHYFEVSVTSEERAQWSFSLQRTHKLPDLYLFPPGGEDNS